MVLRKGKGGKKGQKTKKNKKPVETEPLPGGGLNEKIR